MQELASTAPGDHWDGVYGRVPTDHVSWFEPDPATSRRLVRRAAPALRSLIDVGGGASLLADRLVAEGVGDVTVLDMSAAALAIVRNRLPSVTLVHADVTRWQPERTWQVWHDRAAFHFLVEPGDRARYVEVVTAAVEPGGAAVVGTFAADGPTQCSGLPTARYDAPGLAAALGPAFALEHAERVVHQTPDGREQPFTWVVLRRRRAAGTGG